LTGKHRDRLIRDYLRIVCSNGGQRLSVQGLISWGLSLLALNIELSRLIGGVWLYERHVHSIQKVPANMSLFKALDFNMRNPLKIGNIENH
jgi:hypothetical protein